MIPAAGRLFLSHIKQWVSSRGQGMMECDTDFVFLSFSTDDNGQDSR